MMWQNASEFWFMGGYGAYVWGSVGVSAALLSLEVVLAHRGRQQALESVCEAMDADAADGRERALPGATHSSLFKAGAPS